MARIRTIKPEFWRDEDLSRISAEAALLAIGLLNHADDEGFFSANTKLIEADVFPLRELSGSVTGMVEELRSIGYIKVFSGSDGKRYGQVVNFEKHQVINKKSPSKIKDLCDSEDDSSSPTVVLPTGKERKGKEHGTGSEEKPRKRSHSPDSDSKTLKTYLADCKAAGAKPIPDDHHVRTWAADAGITADMLQIAWVQFRERYTEAEKGKGKRYKDWPGHFANAVKANWFKLWFSGDKGMQWTSVGMTHKNVLDSRLAQKETEHA